MNYALIKSITLILCLVVCSFYDIRKKAIPVVTILISGAAILLLSMLDKRTSLADSMVGLLLGVSLLALGKVSKGAIGIGDGLIMLLVGWVMGIYGGCVVLFYSLFLACIVSIILMCLKKLTKKDAIPFIPFVLISYLGVYLG